MNLNWPELRFEFDWNVILAYAFGVGLLYLVARVLLVPIRFTLRLLVNGEIGILLLVLFNFVGGFFGLYLPLNPVTAVVAGFLGIPGIVLLLALQYLVST